MVRIFPLAAAAALALACSNQYYRLTGPMPPAELAERCNAYARAVEAEPLEEPQVSPDVADGDPVGEDAGAQHGVDVENQQSERARNAYAGCLARNGY